MTQAARACAVRRGRTRFANVAAGRLDAFFEQGINVWGHGSGQPADHRGRRPRRHHTGDADFLHRHEIVAANPKIYAQMIPILKGYTRASGSGVSPGRAHGARLRTPLAGIVMTAHRSPPGCREATIFPHKGRFVRLS